MKIQINRERLFDPKLRAFVARREYVEAIRYYRNQYQSDRAEATEAIDFVREQLERERDSGAAPPTIEAWSHAPVTPQEPATNIRFEAPPPEKLSEEEEEETEQSEFSSEAPEETTEEYDDPDENLNSSPYELPGTFGRPELERVYQQEKTAKQIDEADPEEEGEEYEDDEDDLFDEDEEVEEIEDEEEEPEVEAEDPTIEKEEEEPVVPTVSEAPIEENPTSVPSPEPVLPPEPVVVQPPRAPLELPKMVVSVPEEPPSGIPSWESLSLSLRREILSLEQQEAIRLYWSEVGCSLSEAKSYVSYWRATKG